MLAGKKYTFQLPIGKECQGRAQGGMAAKEGAPDLMRSGEDSPRMEDSKKSEGMIAIQSAASMVSLSFYAGIMVLHAMVVRSGLAYAGLLFP